MKLYNLDNLTCDDCRHQRNGKCTGGSWFCDHMEMFTLSGEAMKRREVDAIPAGEAKEEIHAHWKFNKDKTFKFCSHCGAGERTFYGTSPAVIGNYCEYCGATMDEVINDEDTGK